MLSSSAAVGSASQSAISPAPTRVTVVPEPLVTITVALPVFPSLVAVIVGEPAVTPVTSPLPSTVATPVVPLTQLIVRPLSGVPFASFGVAVSCTVWFTETLADAGLTLTDATGATVTVMFDVPLLPSLVAVMIAEPAVTPVTRPLPSTVATLVVPLTQLIVRPVSGVPFASCGV